MNNYAKDKCPFLFVDDYGMGGIWVYVIANSPSDVIKKYPRLKYVNIKPSWLLKYEKEHSLLTYDIDENPEKMEYLKRKGG
jgi:hypothetical protein